MSLNSPAGLLRRMAAFLAWGVLLVLGFMFSMVLLSIVIVAGLLLWAYLWWKSRDLRKQMAGQPPSSPSNGQVFEGEAVVVEEVIVQRPVIEHSPAPRE